MKTTPDTRPADAEDQSAEAMTDRLRKEVASFREGRVDRATREATELSVAAARSIVPPVTAKMRPTKPAAEPTKAATAEKKPFGMSYGGTSRAEYLKDVRSRGGR